MLTDAWALHRQAVYEASRSFRSRQSRVDVVHGVRTPPAHRASAARVPVRSQLRQTDADSTSGELGSGGSARTTKVRQESFHRCVRDPVESRSDGPADIPSYGPRGVIA